jgi:hypothetical protein
MNKLQLQKLIHESIRDELKEGWFDNLVGLSDDEKESMRSKLAQDPDLLAYFDRLVAQGTSYGDAFYKARLAAKPGMLGVEGFDVPEPFVRAVLGALARAEQEASERTAAVEPQLPDGSFSREDDRDEHALKIIAKLRKTFNEISGGGQLRTREHGMIGDWLLYLSEQGYTGFNRILSKWNDLSPMETNSIYENKRRKALARRQQLKKLIRESIREEFRLMKEVPDARETIKAAYKKYDKWLAAGETSSKKAGDDWRAVKARQDA